MKRTLSTLALALLASACGVEPTGITEPADRPAYDDGPGLIGSGNSTTSDTTQVDTSTISGSTTEERGPA